MTITDALAVLLRRWVVVVVGGLLSITACVLVFDTVPPTYQASGNLLFVLPQQATGKSTPTNPLLNLQEGLATTASLVGNQVSADEVREDLESQGYDASYSAALVPGTGPVLNITTESTDPDVAIATRNAVIGEINARVAALQGQIGTPSRQTITTTVADLPAEPAVLGGNRTRALAGVAALGLLLTLLAAFAFDALAPRASQWRRRRAADGATDGGRGASQPGPREEDAGIDELMGGRDGSEDPGSGQGHDSVMAR